MSTTTVKKSAKKKIQTTTKAGGSGIKKTVVKKVPGRKIVKKKPRDLEIVHPEVNYQPYFDITHNPKAWGPLTVEQAKEKLGWVEEREEQSFGDDYILKVGKVKVRFLNCPNNRYFDQALCRKWMLEILRGKWRLNGQDIIIDCYGRVQSGQHRLAALILAGLEVAKDPEEWSFWKDKEPCINIGVKVGVPGDEETINTLDIAKPRSFADVLYRSPFYQDLNRKQRNKVAKVAGWAVKFVWQRTGQAQHSQAPHMPHSEAYEFLSKHPTLNRAIRHIVAEDDQNQIGGLVPPGLASGLCYLMMCSQCVEREAYEEVWKEITLAQANVDKAEEFWVEFANKTPKLESLLEALNDYDFSELELEEEFIPTGSYLQQLRTALVAKSWEQFSKGKPVENRHLKLKQGKDEYDHPKLLETPLFGGIDIGD